MAPSLAALARRGAAALATAAVLCAVGAPAASADSPAPATASPKLPDGLYGDKDPQYDGVWRQSLTLLAQDAVGERPARSAVDWLTGQQCADGSFTAFRPEPVRACDGKTLRDTNQTAVAVQALAAIGGHDDAVKKAVTWLKSVQQDDGGWSSMAGAPSDTNSTSVVIGALAAAGEKPEAVTSKKGGKNPYDALAGLQLGCDAKDGERGAFAFQPGKDGKLAPNDDATAAAALGALGKGYLLTPTGKDADAPVTPLTCPAPGGKPDGKQAAQGAADHLVRVMKEHGHHLMSAMPGAEGQPDTGNTADAVLALAAGGHRTALQEPLKWLQDNGAAWAQQTGPAGYAQLVLTAHAAGTDPRAFGGTDLVAKLNATGPKPAAATDSPEKARDEDGTDDDSGTVTWWIVGVFFVASVGAGFLLSGRRKKNQL
ncbi:prenyltransferase/squalene oxidase repeat-containing protein [Streptomyces sp. NPDC003077]|uniref:prenyltransferase/squalene oxidase repeat-containing protein n=1 Tax=Streptomyces sp. NPDC003077 TaxID=3154443 RepID=UPI0033BA4931